MTDMLLLFILVGILCALRLVRGSRSARRVRVKRAVRRVAVFSLLFD